MSLIKRYQRLTQDYNLFKEGQLLTTNHIDLTTPFSHKLADTSRNQGYQVFSSYGSSPKVIMIGFTHTKGNEIDQDSSLDAILKENLSEGDMILLEGKGPSEVVYEFYRKSDFIKNMREILAKNNIRTIFNDDNSKVGDFITASKALRKIEASQQDNLRNNNYLAAIENYMQSLDERDINFCNSEDSGIIPFIEGTTENYRKLGDQNKIFQLVGALHLFNGVIQKTLEEAEIPYIVLVPEN